MKLIRMFYARIWLYMLAIVALLSIAAQGDIPEFGTLEELIVWIAAGGGSMILAGLVVAYFLENFGWWHNLPTKVKLVIPMALAAVFGFAAQSLLALEVLTLIPPTLQGVLLTLIAWLAGQVGYKSIKSGAYAASAQPGPDG